MVNEAIGRGAVAVRVGGRLALVLAVLLALMGLALAPSTAGANGVADYPLCSENGAQSDPAAHGDRVVWVDQRANPSGWIGDIWMYDYASGEETQITNDEYEQTDPDIWGDWVVWSDWRNGNGDVYAKNVVTGEERAICTNAASQQRPKIVDDVIVWEDYRNGEWDIYRHRISTGHEAGLSTGGDDRSPDVYRDTNGYIVAWEDAGGDLRVWNLDNSENRIPMENIYGATLVAGDDEFVCGRFEEDAGTGQNVLHLYRYSWNDDSLVEIPTSYEPYAEFRKIAVSGDKVAYTYYDGLSFKVRVHDWSQGQEAPATSAASAQSNPAIAGDMLVWSDDRNFAPSSDNSLDLYTNRAVAAEPSAITTTSTSKTLAKYGDAYTLTGTLQSGGAGVAGKTVVLQRAGSASGTFTDATVSAVTAADGTFSLAHVPAGKTWYRASFAGDAQYEAATSSPVSALPRAFVGNPVAASVMYVNKAKSVYSYLKPRHTASTYPLRIYKDRYVSGKWKAYGYSKAKAANYSTYTKCTVSLKLASKGKWRLRAYHPADAGHAASWSSGYDYVTVK